jgi:hypothetical protein
VIAGFGGGGREGLCSLIPDVRSDARHAPRSARGSWLTVHGSRHGRGDEGSAHRGGGLDR